MSNNELVGADCPRLALEQRKVADNIKHLQETSSAGGLGAILLGTLEILSASKSGQQMDTNRSAGVQQAELADKHSEQARQLEERQRLIGLVQQRKGCAS